MDIVFFGSGRYVLPILETLTKNFNLVLVLTTERKPQSPVPSFCSEKNIPFISLSSKEDLLSAKKLLESKAEAAVLANFRLVVPPGILNAFPKGIINVHPSLLPRYRGSTPGQTAILNNDNMTGVTLIKLDKEIDHGPIIVEDSEEIKPDDTTDSLYERLFAKGAELLEKNLPDYLKEKIELKTQKHTDATYTNLLTREDGYIDLSNPPTREILDLMVRAYYPWPGVWTKTRLNNKSAIVKFLPGGRIQVEGKTPVSYKDFINGYEEISKPLLGVLQSGS